MPTYTSQPDETVGIDTYINSNAATTNYGTNVQLFVGRGSFETPQRTLIKFDLSSIPADAVVSSAILYITYSNDWSTVASTLGAYRQLRAWVEAQATWDIYSTGNNWEIAGGFGPADCVQTDMGTVSLPAGGGGGEISIALNASEVNGMINGAFANNGFLLKVVSEVESTMRGFHSSSAASGRPKLVIEYEVISPSVVWW